MTTNCYKEEISLTLVTHCFSICSRPICDILQVGSNDVQEDKYSERFVELMF